MALWSRNRGAIQRDSFARITPPRPLQDPALAEYLGYGYSNDSGESVGERSSLGLTAVYRSVSIIASSVAGMSLKSYRDAGDGSVREQIKSVWDDPGGDMFTPYELIHTAVVHMALHGNAFLLHIYNGAGQLTGFFPVHPGMVTVKYDKDSHARVFTCDLGDGKGPIDYYEDKMTQVMLFSLDGLTGVSPIRLEANAIGTGIAGDRAAARMFANGLLLGGVVSAEGITPEQGELIRTGLKAKLGGSRNAGDIAVVNASLTFSPWTMNAADGQFIESRAFQLDEVARIFGVPKVLLAEDGASTWGSGIAELVDGFSKFTLRAYTAPFEQRASETIRGTGFCEFDYTSLLQGTPAEEIQLLMAQVQAGLLTTDEARAIRNLPPIVSGPAPDPEVVQALALAQAAPSLVQNPGLPALVDQLRVLAGKAPLNPVPATPPPGAPPSPAVPTEGA